MERSAQSVGHNNQRQKIQHLHQIKEANISMRNELKKARNRIAQLEIAGVGESSSRATASSTVRRLSSGSVQNVSTPSSARKPPLATRRNSCAGPANAQVAREPLTSEAIRRTALKEHEHERLLTDYNHLTTLVERAIVCEGSDCLCRLRRELSAAVRPQMQKRSSPMSLVQVAGLPATPDRRAPVDGLSDLGDQSEVPDAASVAGVEEAAEA